MKRALIVALTLTLSGCYYWQAARGQLELTFAREPVDELLADPELHPALRDGLLRAQAALSFAHQELGLPDNGSYRHLVQLDRPYVTWNVFAAPRYSLEPELWCFPLVGCVAYRGYFSQEAAEAYAAELAADGLDVAVAGVPAYSTLGRLRDPLLDDMLRWPDPELAGLLFHELAHQQLYLHDDSAFNEGFATAVEEIGVARWLARDGAAVDPEQLAAYRARRARRDDFNALLALTRDELASLYASGVDEAAMAAGKAAAFADLERRYRELRDGPWAGYPGYDGWFERELNNARLLPVITYRSWVPAFLQLHAEAGGMADFLAAAAELAELEPAAREAELEALEQRALESAPTEESAPADAQALR